MAIDGVIQVNKAMSSHKEMDACVIVSLSSYKNGTEGTAESAETAIQRRLI